jgi:hypothetical protein
MICIKCYDYLKSFETFKENCIQNQSSFEKDAVDDEEQINYSNGEEQQEIEEYEVEEQVEDLIEYEAGEEIETYDDDSSQNYLQDEVAGAVEKILDGKEEEMKPLVSVVKRTQTAKRHSSKNSEKDKAKESYQRLLQQCEICEKMIEKNRMEGHINKHNNHRPFTCPECDKTFFCKQLLRLHRTSIHTNMQIKCEVCNKMFPSARALYSHTLRHKNEDRYSCEFCEVINFRSNH